VGNRSRHSSRLSGLQHLPSVVERATLIAHADMYYSTPSLCIGAFTSKYWQRGCVYTHPEDINSCLTLDYVFGFAGFRQAKDKTLEDAFLYVCSRLPPHSNLLVSLLNCPHCQFILYRTYFPLLGVDCHSQSGLLRNSSIGTKSS